MAPESVGQAWIGVNHRSLAIAKKGKRSKKRPKLRGVLVTGVTPGGPGETAGIKEGDMIVTMDGKLIPGSPSFAAMLARKKPGTTVRLVLQRDKVRRNVIVVVAERP